MRITTYKTYNDDEQHNFLVKERSFNYVALKNLNSPKSIWEVMKNVFHLHELAEEETYLICLNSANMPTGFFLIGKGTANACPVNTRDIFIKALLASAVKIILCHNHPSQDITASKEDICFTQKVQEAGNLMGIYLVDHIIISKNRYFSFCESNLL